MRIALAGNPNSGKTTLFNALTGSTAHVGNWPGVTVEHKEGTYKDKNSGEKHSIIDLPGIYSLAPYTPEEVVSRRYLLAEKPDVIINIVDATNLERNLYLTTQLLEIDTPIVIALNMMDVLQKNKGEIDAALLQERTGVPVVPISALKGSGKAELMEKVLEQKDVKRLGKSVLEGSSIKKEFAEIQKLYADKGIDNVQFRAVKMLEGDNIEKERNPEIFLKADEILKKIDLSEYDNDFEALVADYRYKYIVDNFVTSIKQKPPKVTLSDKIDRILTNKWAGIPIFLAIMFVVFHITFSGDFLGLSFMGILEEGIPSLGVFLQESLGAFTGWIIELCEGALENAPDWVSGLLVGGILSGLDAVLSFLPQILLLFLFLSILEDSGYMARVAFIMDRAFRRLGLSGKAFMPLLMCFGCAVPGIMATRTLGNEKERKLSIFLSPFFSCGAKLPIWATITAFAFPNNADFVVFAIYVIGIAVAVLAAFLLSKTLLKGEVPPFIMELPSYHLPHVRNILAQLWEKLKHYIFRAGTIILGAIVVIWFLSNFSFTFQMVDEASEESILGIIGNVLRPIFIPLGFASGENGWKFVVAIFTGLIAKEMVVATMGVLSGVEDALDIGTGEIAGTGLGLLISGLTGPAALSFMLFNLLSVPCMAAVAAASGELKSRKSVALAIGFWLVCAYVVSFIVYWVGNMFTTGSPLGIVVFILAIGLVAFTVIFNFMRYKKKKANGTLGCDGSCSGCNKGCM